MNTRIPSGTLLVYYFLMRDHVRCNPEGAFLNGTNEAGRLFETLADATAYAKHAANASSRVGTGIYDHSGTIIAEYLSDDFATKLAKAESPSRLFLWAALFLLSGCACIWIELGYAGIVLVGFLIGARLILSGLIKLSQGIRRLLVPRTRSIEQ